MNITQFISIVCPNGVQMIPVGDVIEYHPGGSLTRNEVIEEGLYPVMNGGIDYSGFYNDYNYDQNVLTISHWGSSAGHIHRHFGRFWANNACWVFKPKDNTKYNLIYLYYILKSKEPEMMTKYCFGGATPNLNRSLFEKMCIPIPPIEIQQEIANILDKFTYLTDKIEEEINLRQKQFVYYREQLLSSDDGKSTKLKLGEIGTFTRGNGLQKADFRDEGFPCIHYGQVHTYYGTETYTTKSFCSDDFAKRLKKVPNGGLIIATTSEDVEACCKAVVWLGDGEVAYSGDSYGFVHNQNPKYIAYLFQTEMFAKQKRLVATGAKVVRVSGDAMANFSFKFPSLEKQQEIVETLDKFESLISKLKEERALRLKQYEYYREKLLTFE